MSDTLHCAVIGVGAFGRNHARVYSELSDNATLAGIVDPNPATRDAAAKQYGVAAFADLDALLAAKREGKLQLHAASVAVPTEHHLAAAKALMEAGVDVLIEKPIASSIAEADQIASTAARTERIAMVGQLERFNPAVLAARKLISRPMFFECHRLSIFTPRSLDVDVVLDLMIHDLDIVLSLVDSPVREVHAVGLPILTRKVDIANVRVEFANGCVANFTASRVSTERVRKLRLFQPHEYLSIDYGRQDLIAIRVDEQIAAALEHLSRNSAAAAAIPSGSPGVEITKPPVTPGEPLRAEIEEFLRAVRTRTAPAVTIGDGSRALGLALAIHQRIEEHRRRAGLG